MGSGGRPSDSMWNSCVAMVELCYENDLEYKISGGSVSEAWNGSTTTSGDEFEFLIDRDAGTVIVKTEWNTVRFYNYWSSGR